tara:strand:+ start:455 stop:991 length:537 start_codon:yes stop_codon:yes gene_type:complete
MNFGSSTTNQWNYNSPFSNPITNKQSTNDVDMKNSPWSNDNRFTSTNVKTESNPWTKSKKTAVNNDQKIAKLDEKIKKLEKKIDTISLNISKRKYLEISHYGVVCSNCQNQNINGIRYMCGNCQQYNLCHKCIIYAEEIHPTNHFFIRIPDTRVWNQINNIQNSTTNMNYSTNQNFNV